MKFVDRTLAQTGDELFEEDLIGISRFSDFEAEQAKSIEIVNTYIKDKDTLFVRGDDRY